MKYANPSIRCAALGAARQIGKSCQMFIFGNSGEKTALMTDVGMDPHVEFSPENFYKLLPDIDGVLYLVKDVKQLFIFITHAHWDHCAGLPIMLRYVKAHYPHLVIVLMMTRATWELAKLGWSESIWVMKGGPKKGDKGENVFRFPQWQDAAPWFEWEDVENVEKALHFVEWNKAYSLAPGVVLTPVSAEHILGAAMLHVNAYGEHVCHTGDISFDGHQFALPVAVPTFSKTKFLFSEATYVGTNDPGDRKHRERELTEIVLRTLRRGGVALIPAFKIDRGQVLQEMLIKYGVYPEAIRIDGGARRVSRIYQDILEADVLHKVQFVEDKEHRHAIWKNEIPCVVIASGGALLGAAAEWAKLLLPDSRNSIIFNGWYDKCTPADALMKASNDKVLENQVMEIDGNIYSIQAEVREVNLSAHATEKQLEMFWDVMNPDLVGLIHGEERRVSAYLRKHSDRKIIFPRARNTNGTLNVIDL